MERWVPIYTVKVNDSRKLVTIDDISSDECPVSLLTRSSWGPAIRSMVSEISKAMRVKEMTGAWPGGSDSGRWGSRFFDAVELAFLENRRYERAVDDVCAAVSRAPGSMM